jgi:hypothetical protein
VAAARDAAHPAWPPDSTGQRQEQIAQGNRSWPSAGGTLGRHCTCLGGEGGGWRTMRPLDGHGLRPGVLDLSWSSDHCIDVSEPLPASQEPKPHRDQSMRPAVLVPAASAVLFTWLAGDTYGVHGPFPFLAVGCLAASVLALPGSRYEGPLFLTVLGCGLLALDVSLTYECCAGILGPGRNVVLFLWPLAGPGFGLVAAGLTWAVAPAFWHAFRSERISRGALLVLALALGYAGWVLQLIGQPQMREGRPLRRLRFPRIRRRASAGERWRQAALDEAEAVTAFVELRGRLIALGAPADLQASCLASARQEVHHARLCTDIANRIEGVVARPPRPPRSQVPARRAYGGLRRQVQILQLCRESLRDGVLGEGTAAVRLRSQALVTEDDLLNRALWGMAADELQHVELAWQTIKWCLSEVPQPSCILLRGLARSLPLRSPLLSAIAPIEARAQWSTQRCLLRQRLRAMTPADSAG